MYLTPETERLGVLRNTGGDTIATILAEKLETPLADLIVSLLRVSASPGTIVAPTPT